MAPADTALAAEPDAPNANSPFVDPPPESPSAQATDTADGNGAQDARDAIAQETSDTTGIICAQVLPTHGERDGDGRSKDDPQARDDEPLHSESPRNPSRAPLIFLFGAAAIIAVWSLSRPGHDRVEPEKTEAQSVARAAIADEPARATTPDPHLGTTEAPVSTLEPTQTVEPAPPSHEQPPSRSANTTSEALAAPLADDDAESIRLIAYKTLVLATKNAVSCRHRGDAPGTVEVAVTFQVDGTVEQVAVRQKLSNPMTAECIKSKLSGLTIRPFSGRPITTMAPFTIY